MELDGETVKQVLIAGLMVVAFVAALVVVGQSFGTHPTVNETTEGDLKGSVPADALSNDSVDGQFNGTLSADVNGDGNTDSQEKVNGTVTGTVTDGSFEGQLNGTIEGTVDGTIEGNVSGTLENDSDELSFDGEFDGRLNGTDKGTEVSPQGGLALVGLLGGFIVAMALAGLWLERQDFDSD